MCSSGSRAAEQANKQSQQQFEWTVAQSKKAEAEQYAKMKMLEKGAKGIDGMFHQFGPEYYQNIADRFYYDYALPQIEESQQDTTRQMRLALARNGILDSSMAANEQGDLQKEYAQVRVDARARGQQAAENRRAQLEELRGGLLSSLYATENPNIARGGGARAVGMFANAPAYEPITDLLAGVGQFAARDYMNAQYGNGGQGLFSPFFNKPGATGNGSTGGSGTTKIVK